MLSPEKNRLLTEVGADTPMGQYLRHYWMPIAGVSELEKEPIKPVRLFGENLVLYKDLSGNYGLVDRHCPHRRADLAYGYVENCGLRCNYHGWVIHHEGHCSEMPFEETVGTAQKMREKVRTTAYPVQAHAGMLWAYFGPQPAPLLPNWEPFSWKNGFTQVVISEIPCNWLQCQENSIDPVHFEWMHMNWSRRQQGDMSYGPKNLKIDFEEFEYGLTYKRVRSDTSEAHPMWSVGRVCLWPNGFFLGDHFEWRVPIDDHNTLSVSWLFTRVPVERDPYVQGEIPTWRGLTHDPKTGRWISSHIINQDMLAWAGQGVVADRTKENLGASDRGIVMLRRRFLEELDAMADGQALKAIIRDPEANRCIPLPVAERELLVDGMSLKEMLAHPAGKNLLDEFQFQYGQPPEIRAAFRAAMGLDGASLATTD